MVGQARPAAMTWARTRRSRSRRGLGAQGLWMVGPELRIQLVGRLWQQIAGPHSRWRVSVPLPVNRWKAHVGGSAHDPQFALGTDAHPITQLKRERTPGRWLEKTTRPCSSVASARSSLRQGHALAFDTPLPFSKNCNRRRRHSLVCGRDNAPGTAAECCDHDVLRRRRDDDRRPIGELE